MLVRQHLKELKRSSMVRVPWIFPYMAGAVVGVVALNLSMKFKGLVPVQKELIYIPMEIAQHMNTTGKEVVATVLNPPWDVDLLLRLIPKA